MNIPAESQQPSLEASRQILGDFVSNSQVIGRVASFDHLQTIITPEITGALSHFILETGHPPTHPKARSTAELTLEHKDARLLAIVSEPDYVHLLEFPKRRFYGYHPTPNRSVSLNTSGDVGHGAVAKDDEGFYLPATTSDLYINFWKGTVGDRQVHGSTHAETGTDVANQALSQAPGVLDGFLRVTAQLTSRLIENTGK